jgi:16S rRNA (guanine966-N2)-methyltransferase
VRVIAGSARGRPLRGPAGRSTRPTADRVKGALFSMLADAVPDAAVLDLYAGTGALGIEALSRGAARALFVDRDPACVRLIRENLRATGLEGQAEVMRAEAALACSRLAGHGFQVVLLDPPYAAGEAGRALRLVAESSLAGPDAVVAVEHDAGEDLPPRAGNLVRDRIRAHGYTRLSLYRSEG